MNDQRFYRIVLLALVVGMEACAVAVIAIDAQEWTRWLLGSASIAVGSILLFLVYRPQQDFATHSDAFSLLSHQLRGPLARLRDTLEVLEGGETSMHTEALAQARQSSEDMQRLVEDVLHASRVQAKGLSYAFLKVDLCDMLDAMVRLFEPAASRKGVRLIWNRPAFCPIEITADPIAFQQALGNIIDNAIKYTPSEGRILVRADVDADTNTARLEVTDTGVGFAANERIFDAFTRGGAAREAYAAGTGLGLYIAKDIISSHRGTLSGTSEGVGQGSSFFIELPQAQ